ncbi:MAG: sensor histidine kinase [Candidatus Limnocylindria bacterium]
MTPGDALRATQLFADLPDVELRDLVDMCELIVLPAGECLIEEGTDGEAFFVIVSGELEVTKRSGEGDLPLARIGPGGVVGEMAVIEGRPRNASVTAVEPSEVLRVPSQALLQVLGRPASSLAILRTVMQRLRSTEALLREREKLAGLGTLAAGLAHELNNPAAAAIRSVRALADAIAATEAQHRPDVIPLPSADSAPPRSALERADLIEEVAAEAGDHDSATTLVDAGWTPADLRAQPESVRGWLAAGASVHQLLAELGMAVERISEIVTAVKGYAYLDRAAAQRVDVRVGLEQTLVILRHRLREITVAMELADDVPEIDAYGSELNQVWTNLIDNATDAMDGRGTLTIAVHREEGDGVRVMICDSGPGIAEAIRGRLFEPFATTKPPGEGTGLGLHISHDVVARHGGRIEVDSAPGRTCFTVILPAERIASAPSPAAGRR